MNHKSTAWMLVLTGGALIGQSACSSARLDPNTRAITFAAPDRGSSGGSAPEVDRDAQNQKELARAANSLAGAGGSAAALTHHLAGAATEPTPKAMTCSELPDPTPIQTKRWTTLSVRFEKGALDLLSAKSHQSRSLGASKRKMGRFAAELWIGCELIDRVRFDFPLLDTQATGKPESQGAALQGPFEATVIVPESERATRLELVDRSRDLRRRFDWPVRAR
jgi:hypothetical protein